MPKKAVAIFFIAAFIGAAIFVYFTFPRTKDEIPTSNNQRPFPSMPEPGPNGVPVPESVPHPTPQKVPPGPTLHVMAWASGKEAKALEAEADAFYNATGRAASLTVISDPAEYNHELQLALASGTPPDVCLVNSRDFSGLDPASDVVNVTPNTNAASRTVAAFTVKGEIKAMPTEYSVNVLFYNKSYFDQAGIGYPDRHWTWDILEAITRAMASLKLTTGSGQPVYPLELPADFDFWNILCMQAGHAALDRDEWHLTDPESKASQVRALDFIHEYFQELSVTAPLQKNNAAPGQYFAQQRSALLIAPSEFAAYLPDFRHGFTLLPSDITRASLARVNGWVVLAKSSQPDAARVLASYLANQPVHIGWSAVQKPAEVDAPKTLCYEALDQSLVPRLDPKYTHLAQFLDQQIFLLAQGSHQKTDNLYARILTEYQNSDSVFSNNQNALQAGGLKPALQAPPAGQLREF